MAAVAWGLAVVTGASAGIGREFCEQLAERGHDLLVVARDRARLEELGRDLERRRGVRVEVAEADLSVEAEVDRLADRLRAGEAPALLVNNAGFGTKGALAETDSGPQAAMVRLHTLAPLRLTQAVLPGMVRRGSGAIVNVSSVASFVHSPGNANYCATKAYLTSLTQGLALEVAGTGVQAQALCPGLTRTEFHQRMQAKGEGPAWAWLSVEQVVGESLTCLDRGGPVVCVPGAGYKILVPLIRLAPRGLIGWVARRRRRM
ncbi:MAG TPA: SDR family oxidoreductase [Gemmatimonadales bacterium]|nr:SDR family oxidoreductase [Gemmatimonadales bacterium]